MHQYVAEPTHTMILTGSARLVKLRSFAHNVSMQMSDGPHIRENVAHVEYGITASNLDQGSFSERKRKLPTTFKRQRTRLRQEYEKRPSART